MEKFWNRLFSAYVSDAEVLDLHPLHLRGNDEHLNAKRQRALELLGESWILHKKNHVKKQVVKKVL